MPPLNTQQRNNAEKAAVELGFGSVDRAKRVMGMDTLTASPSAVNVVPPKIGTEGVALGGMIASQPDYTKQLTDAATASQQTTDQAFNGYLEGLRGKIGETQATAKAYEKKGGVDDLQKKLNTYDQQLAMEQNALRLRQEAIAKNAQGGLREGVQNELDRVERESLAKQANISIIRAGVAQDYSTAKAIADRAVAVQMEKQGNTIEALKLNYERNRDLFTTAEKRAFEAKQKDRENAYNEELTNRKEISDLSLRALENGADGALVMSIRQAKTPEEAQQLLGNFLAPRIAQERALEMEAKRQNIASSRALANQRNGGGLGGDGTLYANDTEALIGTVLSTIPTKFGQQQFQNQISKARNDADRLNIVASQVLKAQGTEVKRDFANQAVGISEIDKAIALIDSGVRSGALQAGAQYTFNLIGKDFDPKLAQINQHITAAIQPYRNSVTGAAWGDQEDAEYAQIFGSTKYEPQELKQRLIGAKEILKSKSANALNAFANPMGYGDNQFATGAYTPADNIEQKNDEALSVFDSVVGTANTTAETTSNGGYLSNLWSAILGK